jgi:outer membrane protein OmpA-like peptidoglycan-associated protein
MNVKLIMIVFVIISSLGCSSFVKYITPDESEKIFFDVNSHKLTPNELYKIKKLVKKLKNFTDFTIILKGYTDKSGDYNKNLLLSERRVKSIKTVMLDLNISPLYILTESLGESQKGRVTHNERVVYIYIWLEER